VIAFREFSDLAQSLDLSEFTTEAAFDIFDISRKGVITIKDYLITMLACEIVDTPVEGGTGGGINSAILFFRLFDLYNAKVLCAKDMGLVFSAVVNTGSSGFGLVPEVTVSEIFAIMATDGAEYVTLNQFVSFFECVTGSSVWPVSKSPLPACYSQKKRPVTV
jgi:hypothetical protein